MGGASFKWLVNNSATWIEREFSEVEIEEAIFDLRTNIAPGLDGFSIVFSNNLGIYSKKSYFNSLKNFMRMVN